MANNYGANGTTYGINPGSTGTWGGVTMPTTIPTNNSSLSIMPSNSREFSEQYPLAPNATMVFINYNQKKLWIKAMHANGLAYDFEDFNLLSNNDLMQYQQQVQNSFQQNQNGNFVSRDEYNSLCNSFDALKKQFEDFIK
jgi:hypothetical protein